MGCPIRDHCREDCDECNEEKMQIQIEKYNEAIMLAEEERQLRILESKNAKQELE